MKLKNQSFVLIILFWGIKTSACSKQLYIEYQVQQANLLQEFISYHQSN